MSKGTVVVTGAAGLVGQAVCSALASSSIDFLPIVRQKSDIQRGFPCDLTQPDALAGIEGPVMAIVHLAAAVPMAAEFPDTEDVAALTRAMDANVLGLAQRLQCPVVYASSCGIYRKVSDLPKVEDLDEGLDPCTPYLRAKYDGERMFLDYGNAVIMRVSAPIGHGMRKTSIVSRYIDALADGAAIRLWGSGARQQNFISVADIAAFVSLVLEGRARGVFNVAARQPVSMRELAETVVAVMGAGRIEFADMPDPNERERAYYDTTKAERILGWVAKETLASMLAEVKGEKFRQ